MDDSSKSILRVEFCFRGKTIVRSIELGPSYQSEPMAASFGPFSVDTLETAAVKIKSREYSRQTIQEAASRLAHQISNEMEDAYGWHGDDRKDSARERIGLPKY